MSATVSEVNCTRKALVPVIIDLGKIRAKKVKQLKKGQGPYLDEVMPAIEQVKAELGKEIDGKEILPVIVLYRRRPKRAKLPTLGLLG